MRLDSTRILSNPLTYDMMIFSASKNLVRRARRPRRSPNMLIVVAGASTQPSTLQEDRPAGRSTVINLAVVTWTPHVRVVYTPSLPVSSFALTHLAFYTVLGVPGVYCVEDSDCYSNNCVNNYCGFLSGVLLEREMLMHVARRRRQHWCQL